MGNILEGTIPHHNDALLFAIVLLFSISCMIATQKTVQISRMKYLLVAIHAFQEEVHNLLYEINQLWDSHQKLWESVFPRRCSVMFEVHHGSNTQKTYISIIWLDGWRTLEIPLLQTWHVDCYKLDAYKWIKARLPKTILSFIVSWWPLTISLAPVFH